jgi:hypothetical protein
VTRAALASALVASALAAASCSGSSGGAQPTSTTTTVSTATLKAAARKAVVAHHRLSVQVLWTNKVPSKVTSVTGSALTALRTAARDRSKRGVRVRVLRESFRVVSLRLDRARAKATAVVADRQTAAVFEHGRRMKQPVRLNERVRIELQRVGKTSRFVVWKVALVK